MKILEYILKDLVSIWGIELINLKIGATGELLWMRHWNSGFVNHGVIIIIIIVIIIIIWPVCYIL